MCVENRYLLWLSKADYITSEGFMLTEEWVLEGESSENNVKVIILRYPSNHSGMNKYEYSHL
jgi:hypothetical protein